MHYNIIKLIKFLFIVFYLTFIPNQSYAKCYWLGYGDNYKCYDNTGKLYYMFGKKNGNGYYKKNYKSGEKADCKWVYGKLKCSNF